MSIEHSDSERAVAEPQSNGDSLRRDQDPLRALLRCLAREVVKRLRREQRQEEEKR